MLFWTSAWLLTEGIISQLGEVKEHVQWQLEYPAFVSYLPYAAPKPADARQQARIIEDLGGSRVLSDKGVDLSQLKIYVSPGLRVISSVSRGELALFVNPIIIRAPPQQRQIFLQHELLHLIYPAKTEDQIQNLHINWLIKNNLLSSHIDFLENNDLGLVAHPDYLRKLKVAARVRKELKQELDIAQREKTEQQDGGLIQGIKTYMLIRKLSNSDNYVRYSAAEATQKGIITVIGGGASYIPSGSTADTDALKLATDILKEEPYDVTRLIIMITDGEGNINTTGKTFEELQEEAKQESIEVIGIGLGGGITEVEKRYKTSIQVEDPQELPSTLKDILEEKIAPDLGFDFALPFSPKEPTSSDSSSPVSSLAGLFTSIYLHLKERYPLIINIRHLKRSSEL